MTAVIFSNSPAVVVNEVDLTTTVQSGNPSTAGFVGHFRWGPIEKAMLIDSEDRLVDRCFKPDLNTFKSFFTAADCLSYASGMWLVRANNSNPKNATSDGAGLLIKNEGHYEQSYKDGSATSGPYAARYASDLGNSLRIATCPSNTAFKGVMTVTANVTSGANLITFSANSKADTTAPLAAGDLISIGVIGYQEVVNVASDGLTAKINTNFTSTLVANSATRKWKYADHFQGGPGTSDYTGQRNGANDEIHIIVLDKNGVFTGLANTVLEKYAFVSVAGDARNNDGTSNYYVDVLFQRSRYVYWLDHLDGATNWGVTANATTFTLVSANRYDSLGGGAIGTPTDANLLTALDLFKTPEAIDISLIPMGDVSNTVIEYAIQTLAETYRKDCIVFFSPQSTDVVETPGNELNNVLAFRSRMTSSDRGFMTCNWKYIYDKYNNVYRWIPDNGAVAGLAARLPAPFFSPAGPINGVLKNTIKLAWQPTKADRDELYKVGVNPVVSFPGEGPQLFGDKTLLVRPSAFDHINVRRLFDELEKRIAFASRFALFQLNDEFTRAQFVNLVEPYLRDTQGRRGINKFLVVCDESNNTGQLIDQGIFVGDIYITPTHTIQQVQLNFIATPTGIQFNEIVGRFG